MAKESKFTEQTRETILRGLRKGLTRRAACAIAGINDRTLRKWFDVQEDEYQAFAAEVEAAEAGVESEMTDVIVNASKEDWKAAQFYLERRSPEWRPHTKADVNANVTGYSLDDLKNLRDAASANSDGCDTTNESEPSS